MDSISIVLLGGEQIVRFGLLADKRRTFIAADACTTACADDEGHLG
jgi:hypothetical protein